MSDQDKIRDYADPNVLVTADWVHERLEAFQSDDSDLRLVEVDVDTEAYDEKHIPGAIGWDWESQLCDQVKRDLVPKDELEELLEKSGISNDTTVVLYGDNHNWFAAWAFWQLKYYGHNDVRLMDGGRVKWLELNYPTTIDVPDFPEGNYSADEPDESLRTYAPDIEDRLGQEDLELVDVRSEEEFTGEKISPDGVPEGAQRGGHIPGATNISWSDAVNEDGTFKSRDELEEIYEARGITDDKTTVAYCRIGERSSHSWFVLRYLLGHRNVENYDGSWTEWGNRLGAPIETGE
jgi:thiosulfate/3-mercaptopyruvate sulfurtransferase